jgi:hypothetical protein
MPKLAMSVPHSLDQQEATNRLKGFLERVRSKYQDQVSDLHEDWGENSGTFSFKTYGFNVKGSVAVEPSEVKVEGDLPFAAMMFKGKVEQTIRENLTRLLGDEGAKYSTA